MPLRWHRSGRDCMVPVLLPTFWFLDWATASETLLRGLGNPCLQLHVILKHTAKISSLHTLPLTFLIQLVNTLIRLRSIVVMRTIMGCNSLFFILLVQCSGNLWTSTLEIEECNTAFCPFGFFMESKAFCCSSLHSKLIWSFKNAEMWLATSLKFFINFS